MEKAEDASSVDTTSAYLSAVESDSLSPEDSDSEQQPRPFLLKTSGKLHLQNASQDEEFLQEVAPEEEDSWLDSLWQETTSIMASLSRNPFYYFRSNEPDSIKSRNGGSSTVRSSVSAMRTSTKAAATTAFSSGASAVRSSTVATASALSSGASAVKSSGTHAVRSSTNAASAAFSSGASAMRSSAVAAGNVLSTPFESEGSTSKLAAPFRASISVVRSSLNAPLKILPRTGWKPKLHVDTTATPVALKEAKQILSPITQQSSYDIVAMLLSSGMNWLAGLFILFTYLIPSAWWKRVTASMAWPRNLSRRWLRIRARFYQEQRDVLSGSGHAKYIYAAGAVVAVQKAATLSLKPTLHRSKRRRSTMKRGN